MSKVIKYGGANLYPKQREAIYDPARWALVEASTKSGKAQPLDSLVYTPVGPVRMGDIRIGDEVLTPTGTARVRDIHPQGVQPIYRVTFSDRASVRCTDDHLWETDSCIKQHAGTAVIPLSRLRNFPESRLSKTYVPRIEPVQYAAQAVPIDPYLLGVLIGDGGLTQERVFLSSEDEQILRCVSALLDPRYYELKHVDRCTYAIAVKLPYQQIPDSDRLGLQLEALGLKGLGSHDKFIPDCYRYNLEDVRWRVLRGIMDTDGSVNSRGQPMLEQTSRRLARDVAEVVESLGGYTRATTKVGSYVDKLGDRIECKDVYRQAIVHPDARQFFALDRKAAKCTPKKKHTRRYFKSIELEEAAPAQCIELDDPRGLYLTDNLLPTHNTIGCLSWLLEEALRNGRKGRNYWWVSPVFGQAFIGFERMRDRLPKGLFKQNQSVPHLALANGAKIVFKSAERPNDLYGEDVYAAVLDEASRMREDALIAMRSTITATEGPIRIIGNVVGRKNWFYRLCRAAEAGAAEGMAFHRITCWDAVDAGVLSRKEIEASRREFELLGRLGAWKQLYMAEASDEGDNPFGLQAIENCLLQDVPLPEKDEDGNFVWSHPDAELRAKVAGVDLAGRGAQNINPSAETIDRDYSAITKLAADGVCTHLERFRKGHTDTTARIVSVVGRTEALIDSTGTGDAIVENLQRRGDMRVEGYTFTEQSRQDLLENLALAIQGMGILFPDGPLRDELDAHEYVYTRGKVYWRVPPGYHDDLTMALALGVKKLPWKRRAQPPEGVGGESRWRGQADGQVAATDPLKSPAAPLALPIAVGGVGGGGRWTGADR